MKNRHPQRKRDNSTSSEQGKKSLETIEGSARERSLVGARRHSVLLQARVSEHGGQSIQAAASAKPVIRLASEDLTRVFGKKICLSEGCQGRRNQAHTCHGMADLRKEKKHKGADSFWEEGDAQARSQGTRVGSAGLGVYPTVIRAPHPLPLLM